MLNQVKQISPDTQVIILTAKGDEYDRILGLEMGADDYIVKPFNPRTLGPAALNDYCGNCHRKPPAAGEATDWSNAWNARHQPIYLAQAKCFQQSRMTCFTCHDPHSSTVKDSCAGCHPAVKHQTVATTGKTCAGCHMPLVRPTPQLRFANHWIGIYASGNSLKPRVSTRAGVPKPR